MKKGETVKSIKLDINWYGYMKSIILLLENGDVDAKAWAKKDLMRLAHELDKQEGNINFKSKIYK
jgi:hypothetical protein